MIKSYRELLVWQKSMRLCIDVYHAMKTLPQSEVFGLTSQIKRCSVSIPSNIAEGFMRGCKKEFKYFLRISYGSCAELDTQLLLAQSLGFISKESYTQIAYSLAEIMKMLNKLISTQNPTTL